MLRDPPEITPDDMQAVRRAVGAWHRDSPAFRGDDQEELISAALEYLVVCHRVGDENGYRWRASYWRTLRWRLLDDQRLRLGTRKRRISVPLDGMIEERCSVDDFNDVEIADLFNRLSPRYRRIARALLVRDTLLEIAEREGVTESAVCLIRHRIARMLIGVESKRSAGGIGQLTPDEVGAAHRWLYSDG